MTYLEQFLEGYRVGVRGASVLADATPARSPKLEAPDIRGLRLGGQARGSSTALESRVAIGQRPSSVDLHIGTKVTTWM